MKENNNLTTIVKEKETIIMALEEQTNNVPEDAYDSSVVEEEVQTRSNLSGHSCTACDKVLVLTRIWRGTLATNTMKLSAPFVVKYFPTEMHWKAM